jgi:hypothetical protein
MPPTMTNLTSWAIRQSMRRRYRLSDMTCALSQAIHGFQRLETLERGIT